MGLTHRPTVCLKWAFLCVDFMDDIMGDIPGFLWVYAQGPANKYISLRDRRSRREDTIFGAKFSIRLFRYYIKFLNKENMHTYSYGVLLYSDGRMPPLVALFADLYQFCTRYVKSNNDLCSADVLTWRVLRAIVNTSAEHRSLLLLTYLVQN